MDIIIQSLGFKASEKLENHIKEKLNTLKYDKLIRANVTLFKSHESTPENNYCQIRLEIPGNDVFAKRCSIHFETAFSSCIDALNETLNRNKSRRVARRQADATKIQDAHFKATGEETLLD